MADRDIPSVPVTTLAGLASLSDLLSELPICESSVITSLHKSLLFHPRVAEEANNLLSIKDDTLTRQLVHALEQTNADHIELKSQYAQPTTSGTNINELPQLLQAIHTLKPTVFKSGSQQWQRNQANNQPNTNVWTPPPPSQNPPAAAAANNHNVTPTTTSAAASHTPSHHIKSSASSPASSQHGSSGGVHQSPTVLPPSSASPSTSAMPPQQQQQQLPQQQTLQPSQQQQPQQQPQNQTLQPMQQQQPQQPQQNLQQQPPQQHQQQQPQPPQQHHKSPLQQKSVQPPPAPPQKQPPQQQPPQQHQPQPPSVIVRKPLAANQMPLPIVDHDMLVVVKEEPIAPIGTIDAYGLLSTSPSDQYQQPAAAAAPPIIEHHQQPYPTQLSSFQSSHLQQPAVVNQNATTNRPPPQHTVADTPHAVHPLKQLVSPVATAAPTQHPSGGVQQPAAAHHSHNAAPKTAPRNSEFLQRHSNNHTDVRGGPSPAQASDAPADVQQPQQQLTTTTTTSSLPVGHQQQQQQLPTDPLAADADATATAAVTTTSTTGTGPSAAPPLVSSMRLPKVSLARLSVEHLNIMEQSLTEFAKKAPDMAQKLGVIDDEVKMEVGGDGNTSMKDMFTMMKADERKGVKRSNPSSMKEEDQIAKFSQPKLRRISSKPPQASKPSKEDVTRSQTYQQFMKNMEHELRRLEEVEQPNNIDDMDYHSDCIPSKMLAQLTNDVAKLKAKGAVDVIPKSKLTLLINFAMRNVDVSRNLSAGPDMDDDNMDDYVEKILDAAEACLLVSSIYASASDIQFLQEDNMDRIVKFVQFQMRETIFPSFDPVFTVMKSKKSDARHKKKAAGLSRSVQLLYTKLVELTKIFVVLFDSCAFVDTIVLAVSTLAVEPFFVDNIETLQFACLELVTTIFRKENYVKYRSSILNDILTSVDRLPCSKKNLRPYKLAQNGGSIQMVTALVLQLIQCSSVLPCSLGDVGKAARKKSQHNATAMDTDLAIDKDLLILEKYDTAFSIGGNFLTTFLNKCKTRSGETDFRPLFENFIYDLLTTVNKPEWPAAELLLSLLGTLLVKYMSDKNIEQAIRVVSLEYLGIVAARLRKDTVESRCKVKTMDALIKCIKLEQEKEGDRGEGFDRRIIVDPEEERTEFLQRILLDFLAVNAQEDNLIWDYARHFYLTQWYKDVIQRKKKVAEGEKGYASRKKVPKKRGKYRTGGGGGDSDVSELDDDSDDGASDGSEHFNDDGDERTGGKRGGKKGGHQMPDQELNLEIFRMLDARKRYFISKIKPNGGGAAAANTADNVDIRTYIDYSNAHLIAQYLASRRPFSQSFDKYLQKIILVVREPSIAIRTKAMKCLAMIVEVDASILKRKDMQMGVSQKLLDTSISVREAAVDLVGKYVLSSPDLIDQYYEMLSKRILDTGVSVRKRVIKILRDICIEHPDFEKIPEICVKMIRRVNDEEGIQKLVTEVFMRMWFTPCADNDMESIVRKINQMSDVVSMAHDTGTTWLDGLLRGIFTPKEEKDITDRTPNAPKKEPPKEVIKACQQLADGLVNAIIQLEGTDNEKVLNCVTTLNLLAKVRPLLLVKHAMTLEPYLNVKGTLNHIIRFISFVAEILQQVVPLMEHPSESFLADLETHLMMLVCSQTQAVVTSCLSCLGAVVNQITKNYKLIRDCFCKCYRPILNSRNQLQHDPKFPIENIFKPMFRRGLFTIGLICRNFDFQSANVYGEGLGQESSELPATICNDIFEHLLYFAQVEHNDIRRDALIALGHFCIKNYDYLTNTKLRCFYCALLTGDQYPVESKLNVLRNIQNYLQDADQSMSVRDKDWQTQSLVENLCDMGDVISGMASRIIQLYLSEVLDSMLHADYQVRFWALKLVEVVLRQGLVHPVKIVPYLIGLSTDTRQEIGHRADRALQEVEKQYPGFVNMKCHLGIQLSYELQRKLQQTAMADGKATTTTATAGRVVRGFCGKVKDEQPTALNGFLYTLLRSTKPQRRALVQSVTKQFDEQRTTLPQMLYLADNLAYFPYLVQDEPLYIIHQVDLFVSNAGTNLLQTFRECLRPLPGREGTVAPVTVLAPVASNVTDGTATTMELDQLELEKQQQQSAQIQSGAGANPLDDEDDDEDLDSILERLPEETGELQKCIVSAQGCILLLMLKQHLKIMYRITEGKISRYSPSEPAKIYEKAMQRHPVPDFQPKTIIDIILELDCTARRTAAGTVDAQQQPLGDKQKEQLVERYLDFKQLMLKIDKEESDNDSDRPLGTATATATTPGNNNKSVPSTPSKAEASTPTPQQQQQQQTANHHNNYGSQQQPSAQNNHIGSNHHQQQQQTPATYQSQSHHQQQFMQHINNVSKSASQVATPRSLKQHHSSTAPQSGQQRRSTVASTTPSRSKRKKRKVVSSSDDSDSDYA